MESPRGMMRTVDWRVAISAGVAATAVINDKIVWKMELAVKRIFDDVQGTGNG
jgi:hypothetical protein